MVFVVASSPLESPSCYYSVERAELEQNVSPWHLCWYRYLSGFWMAVRSLRVTVIVVLVSLPLGLLEGCEFFGRTVLRMEYLRDARVGIITFSTSGSMWCL